MSRRFEEGLATGAVVVIGGALLWSLWGMPLTVDRPAALDEAVGRLDLGNPVTAVLLDVRAFDTLLELAVLLLALAALIAAGPGRSPPDRPTTSPVLRGMVRLLLPALVVVAGVLLWAGADRPGGAFQAGALLGAGGVLWRLSGLPIPLLRPWGVRLGATVGLLTFLALGTAVGAFGLPWLGWPVRGGKELILAVEVAATLSIGAILAALFAGGDGR